jgi:gliding motility-associated-like protein
VIKFKAIDTLMTDSVVCNIAGFVAPQQILKDVCGYDSALVTYNPVMNKSPFDQTAKRDTIFEGQKITLPSMDKMSITWNNHPTLSCTQCAHPVATPFNTTTYTATSQVNGCNVSDNFTVVVLKDAVVQMPNAFSPNGDGINDAFGPAGKVPEGYQLQIFNRYGQIVYRSSSINDRWDGRVNGVAQSTGVFVYQVQYKNVENQLEQKKGTLTLVR